MQPLALYLSQVWQTCRWCISDNSIVIDYGVLDHYNDTVLDHPAFALTIGFLHPILVDNLAIGSNSRVFVNDGFSHCGPSTCMHNCRSI